MYSKNYMEAERRICETVGELVWSHRFADSIYHEMSLQQVSLQNLKDGN